MWPYVIEEPFRIGTYGVMMAVGFLIGYWLLVKEYRRRNVPVQMAETTIFICIVAGVLGAKLIYMITEAPVFRLKDLVSGSGLTWHGGFLLALTSLLVYYRLKKKPLLVMLDALAPMIATGYASGRVGCQLAGDGCYGVPCSVTDWDYAFCMSYPNGIVPTTELVHPTPVYEMLVNVFLFFLLWNLRKRIRHPGILFAMYCIGAGLLRFFVEFIRTADGRPDRFWGLRDAHLVALGIVAVGIAMWVYAQLRKVPTGQEYGVLPAPKSR